MFWSKLREITLCDVRSGSRPPRSQNNNMANDCSSGNFSLFFIALVLTESMHFTGHLDFADHPPIRGSSADRRAVPENNYFRDSDSHTLIGWHDFVALWAIWKVGFSLLLVSNHFSSLFGCLYCRSNHAVPCSVAIFMEEPSFGSYRVYRMKTAPNHVVATCAGSLDFMLPRSVTPKLRRSQSFTLPELHNVRTRRDVTTYGVSRHGFSKTFTTHHDVRPRWDMTRRHVTFDDFSFTNVMMFVQHIMTLGHVTWRDLTSHVMTF